ncbi:Arc family DNA-binding protein [Rhizobium grahamii]|uniref:Arc domain-containing protein n=1 Tax=Rhizobium grahamii CCGE 502 TaxID=990285 RepID=S3IHR9_9HYPH|nr:Arc family DNA-binding protein [Rhizobium grahamii]EPE98448.1 Arc domain-containing protein [Rhizobium grahamii CCGE 502]
MVPQNSESRDLDKVIVRLPDGMRDQLKTMAAQNNRSMNAEIVARLAESLEIEAVEGDPAASLDALRPVFQAVQKEVAGDYERRLAAIEEILAEVSQRLGTTYYPPLPQNTKTDEDEQ